MKLRLLILLMILIGLRSPLLEAKDDKKPTAEGVVNKLLAPGPLIEGHKNMEHGDCLKCHDAGQGVPDNKCLSCHSVIQQSVKEKDSFHGKTTKPCIACHSDHKGRNFNSTQVSKATFNHALTGFVLSGKHAKIACTNCHTEKRTTKPVRKFETRFFGKDDSCKSCHKKDDIHHFPPKLAAKECGACHNESSWKNANFDHKKETGYALIGDHAALKCNKCHAPKGEASAKYDFPELKTKQCLTCHADFHKDGLSPKFRGGACDRCHAQTTWKLSGFDHSGTGFPLKGAHAKQSCTSCHGKGKGHFTGLSETCVSCHKDYHGFGKEAGKEGALANCQQCHVETAWKPALSFNHNTDTSYPITGKHKTVKCFSCHKLMPGQPAKNGIRDYEFPQLETKTCETCHKSPHAGSPSKVFKTTPCAGCHVTDGWKLSGRGTGGVSGGFSHQTMTRFPLTGDHQNLSCDRCHKQGKAEVYKFNFADKGFCESCHKSVHAGQFSDKFAKDSCGECHDTVDFKNLMKLNHAETRFVLTGEHLKIAQKCTDCHVASGKKLPTSPPKPAHKFQFAHDETGFCVDCHKNVHKDQFSSRFPADDCKQCHVTQSFKSLLAFDHDKTRFKLTGDHLKIKDQCVKCHVKTDKMLATLPPTPAGKFKFPFAEKEFCEGCHASVHKDQFEPKFLGKACSECHTTVSFDKRPGFDHGITDFKLTGAHAKIENQCVKCHVKTKETLQTKPPKPAGKYVFAHDKTGYCEACHQSEHAGQFHDKFADKPCRVCHGVQAFEKRLPFNHNLTRLVLKGKHLKLKCQECHEPTKEKFKASPHHFKGLFIWGDLLAKNCATCHKDPHQGKFGKVCSECHVESGWDDTAEFHKNFQLSGVHYLLECSECHQDKRRLSGLGNDCKVCHQKDDAHLGTQPDCASCHTQQFWAVSKFQHSMTSFPLRGAHRLLDCDSCHAHGVYEGLDPTCASCHFRDAEKVTFPNHKLPGFETCDQCHNSFSFPGAK